MSIALILPARRKSTRLAEKLLLNKTGKTVLEHTIERAREAQSLSNGLVTTVLVAVDDPDLFQVAERAGVKVVMTRSDHPSGTDRLAEAAAHLKESIVVNVQADEPELPAALILKVAALVSHSNAVMSTLAVPILDEDKFLKPNVVKVVVDQTGKALYFSRAPIPFAREPNDAAAVWRLKAPGGSLKRVFGLHHLGLYAYRREFLAEFATLPPSWLERLEKLEQLRVLENGYSIMVGLARSHPPGIDTPEDYTAFVDRWTRTGGKLVNESSDLNFSDFV